MIVLTEVLLQGLRDMLHDRGEKRKALTGAGRGYETVEHSALVLLAAQCLRLMTCCLY